MTIYPLVTARSERDEAISGERRGSSEIASVFENLAMTIQIKEIKSCNYGIN